MYEGRLICKSVARLSALKAELQVVDGKLAAMAGAAKEHKR